jgi:predicted transcriptional regulator
MPKKRSFSRVAITLPTVDLEAADRIARSQDRSRSWVVAEAVRRYAVFLETESASESAVEDRTTAVAVSGATPSRELATHRPGLGRARLDQLRLDLKLTPEERIRAAEETLRLSRRRGARQPRQLLQFDRFEDYLDWKRLQDVIV